MMKGGDGLRVIALLGQRKHSRLDNAQTIMLANALAGKDGVVYQKSIYFNILINLPSWLLFFIPVWMLIKHNDGFRDVENCDIIVTCGKNMIRYAKHLKNNSYPDAKLIQIGNPRYTWKCIDALLRPHHGRSVIPCKNTIRYRGHFCEPLDKKVAEEMDKKYKKIRETWDGDFIGVFVGRDTTQYKMTTMIAKKFAMTINTISHNMKMPLLISVDQGVSKNAIDTIKRNLDCNYYLYVKAVNPNESPKVAFMDWSKFYIITGNSIVDQSELMSQDKPVYIYYDGKHSYKYKLFYNDVISDGCARPLTTNLEKLDDFKPVPLNDMENLVLKIKTVCGMI